MILKTYLFCVTALYLGLIAVNVNAKPVAGGAGQDLPLLILISFDGFRWDYLENYTLPYFEKYFVQQGVKANRGIKNAFSTVTFPNHWTIATGLYPESHGIVANAMYDDKLNQAFYDYGAHDNDTNWFGQNPITMPIWLLNQLSDKANRRSGVVGAFPGSNVKIANETTFVTVDYALDDKLNWFVKVDTLINWFLNSTNPINMGVLYFPEPDDTGHQYGPYSTQIRDMIYKCDAIVGYLVRRLIDTNLYSRMNIIITSDHGMDTATPDKAVNLNEYVDISKFDSYGGLTQINIFPKDPNDEEELYRGLKKIKNYNVYRRADVISRLNYKNNNRIGPLVFFGDVGYETFRSGKENFDWDNWKGDHGGDNAKESMHPLFVARGPAFKEGYLAKQFNNTDIYILMCTVLGITPMYPHNGSYDNIKGMLETKPRHHHKQSDNDIDDLKLATLKFQFIVIYPNNQFLCIVIAVLALLLILNILKRRQAATTPSTVDILKK